MNPEVLELFCQAVSDVGSLSWWAAEGDTFQVEFTATQLLGQPLEPGGSPSGTVAVRFSGDAVWWFLRRADASLDASWPQRLQGDQLNPLRLRMDPHFLWHGDGEDGPGLDRLVQCIQRDGDPVSAFSMTTLANRPWRMLVWAGDVGIAVAARQAEPVNHAGVLSWADVPELYRGWWSYWESYWKVRDSARALPWDYACEATIPLEA